MTSLELLALEARGALTPPTEGLNDFTRSQRAITEAVSRTIDFGRIGEAVSAARKGQSAIVDQARAGQHWAKAIVDTRNTTAMPDAVNAALGINKTSFGRLMAS